MPSTRNEPSLPIAKLAPSGIRSAGSSSETGGKSGGVLFVKGEEPRKVEGDLAEQLIAEVRRRIGRTAE